MRSRRGRAIVGVAGELDPANALRAVASGAAALAHRGPFVAFGDVAAGVFGAVSGTSGVTGRSAEIDARWESTGALELRADAVGRRSLFVAARSRFVVFASELGAIGSALRVLGETLALDVAAWRRFLAFSFVPAPRTPFQGVLQVPPGHAMTWAQHPGLSAPVRWFDTPVATAPFVDDEEAVAALLGALDDAVRVESSREREVALLLSGGLDSAAVAASLARLRPGALSLTIDLEEDSEGDGAAEIAKALGLAHHRLLVNGDDVARCLPGVVAGLDTPIGDPVVAPFFLAARSAGVSELWNGEGGDQLLAGWATKPMLAWARYADADDDVAAAYLRTFHKLADVEDEALGDALRESGGDLADELRPFLTGDRARRHQGFLDLLCDANLWLKGAGNLLPRIDRMCAAHGIDAVSPLLDPGVLDVCFRLAPSQKQRGVTEKWILREALKQVLPPAALSRPKRGMRAPLRRWLDGPLKGLVTDTLTSRAVRERGFLRPAFVQALLADEVRAPDLRRRRRDEWLWLAFFAELWLVAHVD